jgi:hypothetical protein
MFASEGNLWGYTREGYINYPEAQRLLGEFRNGKALKEVKLVDGLLKYKQSWVYAPQRKLRLFIFREKYHTTSVGHKREKLQ